MKDYAPFRPGRRRYRMILQADHKTVPPIIRLRRLLKRLLRSFGFTCLEVVDITHGGIKCTANCAAASSPTTDSPTNVADQPPSDTPSATNTPSNGFPTS